jgi:GxxExxY protein
MDVEEVPLRERFEPNETLNRLAHSVIGAAIEVHRHLGPGHLESVYEEAICVELTLRGISFARQFGYGIDYKGRTVGTGKLDLLIGNDLVVELKACDGFAPIHTAQVLSYLKATGRHLGLIINFNVTRLQDGVKRVIYS